MTVIKQLETLGMDNQTPSCWHCMMKKTKQKNFCIGINEITNSNL